MARTPKHETINPRPCRKARSSLHLPKGWVAFEVGEDFTENKELMKFLAERKRNAKNRGTYSLEEVEAELGLR